MKRLRSVTISMFILTLLSVLVAIFVNRQISLGYGDADDPEVMLGLLNHSVHTYRSSGIVFVGMALTLGYALVTLWEIYLSQQTRITRMGLLFGTFATLFLLAFGILRVQSTGTLLHIEPINPEWAQAGYMVVQVAGTQGYISGAVVSFSIFVMCLSLDNLHIPRFAKWLSWAGLGAPCFMLFMLFFGPFLQGFDGLFPVYISSILLIFLWPSLFGISLMQNFKKESAFNKVN